MGPGPGAGAAPEGPKAGALVLPWADGMAAGAAELSGSPAEESRAPRQPPFPWPGTFPHAGAESCGSCSCCLSKVRAHCISFLPGFYIFLQRGLHTEVHNLQDNRYYF
ncbi:unnamed protein product [Coccothraustes coccothraustes]